MGNVQKLTLYEEQDSVSEPGTKCITSSPLSMLDPPLSAEDWEAESLLWQRFPIKKGWKSEAFLKSVEVFEHGPRDFTSKIILDGQKLDAEGHGRGDGTDRVIKWGRTTMGQDMMTMTEYVDEATGGMWADEITGEVVLRARVHFLRDPERFEWCIDMRNTKDAPREKLEDPSVETPGECSRDASQARASIISIGLNVMSQMYQDLALHEVKVSYGVSSKKEAGQLSNMSDEIEDSSLSYVELFQSMVEVLQKEVADPTDCSKVEVSGDHFDAEALPTRNAADHQELFQESQLDLSQIFRIRREVEYSEESGEIGILEIAVKEDGSVAWPAWSRLTQTVVHQAPLMVESWEVDLQGGHTCTKLGARRLQMWINASIEAIEGRIW